MEASYIAADETTVVVVVGDDGIIIGELEPLLRELLVLLRLFELVSSNGFSSSKSINFPLLVFLFCANKCLGTGGGAADDVAEVIFAGPDCEYDTLKEANTGL